MNATDLMVGDLVLLFGDTPARVDAIGDTEVYVYEKEQGDWHVGYEHIKPIPITPAILEKNGFEDVGSEVYECDVLPFYIWWERDRHRLGIDIEDSTYDMENFAQMLRVPVSYVHDLQHCLKLVGIDKEITI